MVDLQYELALSEPYHNIQGSHCPVIVIRYHYVTHGYLGLLSQCPTGLPYTQKEIVPSAVREVFR